MAGEEEQVLTAFRRLAEGERTPGERALLVVAPRHPERFNAVHGLCAAQFSTVRRSGGAPVTADCIAACTHGERFAAMVVRGHIAGAQFHPERSSATGARLLANFLQWNPT